MDQCNSCAYRKHRDKLSCCLFARLAYAWREMWRSILPCFNLKPYRCHHWDVAAPVDDGTTFNCRCSLFVPMPQKVTLCQCCVKWYPVRSTADDKETVTVGFCIKDHEYTRSSNGCCEGHRKEDLHSEPKT